MKLRNKKTGEIIDLAKRGLLKSDNDNHIIVYPEGTLKYYAYDSLTELNEEWEDYEPSEPFFDEKIRKAIKAWWEIQDNPFKSASVLCTNNKKDADGFYNYRIFGYIQKGECKISTDLEFRTNKFYEYDSHKDYSKEELCGEED